MENFKMEMMFLIVKLAYASVTIPEKYPAEQCKSIAAEINNSRYEAICIPAPKYKCHLEQKPVATGNGTSVLVCEN